MANRAITSGTEASVIIPQVWSQRYYDVLLADLPFNSIISRDYEGEIQNLGDRVNVSSFPEFDDAVELAEDQAADASAITITQKVVTINKRVVKDFIVTNKAMLQSLPMMDKLKEMAIHAINKKIQALIIALSVPSATAPDNSIAYDSSTTLALADALEVKELLDTANCPLSGRHTVLGAAQLNDIFNITGFTSSQFLTNGAPLQTGELPPMLLGFIPHFTTVVGNTSYWFHNSYATIAAQQGMETKVYDRGVDGERSSRVNLDTLLGMQLMDSVRLATLS